MVSETCECNGYVFKFDLNDAEKEVQCPNCDRTYKIFLEVFDEHGQDYDLALNPVSQLLID